MSIRYRILQTLAWLAVATLPLPFSSALAQGVTFSSNVCNIGGFGTGIRVADINRDGKMDLLALPAQATGYDGRVLVLTNNGSGVLSSNTSTYGWSYARLATVGELNGDQKTDLIFLSTYNNTLQVRTNNGGSGFGSNATYSVSDSPLSAVTVDVDGDGTPDVACANRSTLTVFTNSGGGCLGSNATYNVGTYAKCVLAADINRDGKPDLITANFQANTLTVLTNDGHGGFGWSATLPTSPGPQCVITADIRGDGNLALVCANGGNYPTYGNTLTVFTNNGSGVFSSNATLTVGSGPACVVAADLNGDGKVDLAALSQSSKTMTVFTNHGDGAFGLDTTLTVGISPQWLVAADLNGDGKPDLVSADWNGLTIFFNTTPSPAPALSITRVGAGLTLSWPAWASNYVLESTPDLSAPNWAAVTNSTPIPGGVSLTNASPVSFFRLNLNRVP